MLIAELQDRIRALEDANRENRRIIAALTSRIPAIEAAPSDERGSPETAEDVPEGAATSPMPLAPRRAPGRPWWRRVFGG